MMTHPTTRGLIGSPGLKRAASSLPLLAVLYAAGCGDARFDYAPVSGQVLLDGEPVEKARVVFMPRATGDSLEAGPYSNGETDSEGRFELRSVEARPHDGAVVGTHRVVVSTRRSRLDPEDPDIEIVTEPERIPRQYTNYRSTPLTIEVPEEGTETANFSLEPDPPGRRR